VSSTLQEMAEERRAAFRAISALRLTPVMFELGARPHPPGELYRAYLAQSDVFIGLYWQRYGQIGPGMPVSGLEEEFELSRGLPRLLYVKVPAPDREPRLAGLLARIEQEASYRTFGTPAELARLVRDDLAILLSERFAAARTSAADPVAVRTSPARSRGPRPLPVSTTSLVGRERAIGEVAVLVDRPEVRLVTLTGPGGIGKTRLAVAAAKRLRGRFAAGMVFVPLAAATNPAQVLASIARAVGADLAGAAAPLEALAETLGDDRWLLILDNLEQVVEIARDLGELLTRCPAVAILATSRTVLGLLAEWEYPVPPLPLPADLATVSLQELESSPAVAMFVERARTVRPGFALTTGNAAAVAEICRRLEGLPLAIELAAARIRVLDPGALLDRLTASLDALGTGAADLPERQHTLRATVEWSVGLLDDAERSLLETVAVFVDGWTVGAAAQVADLGEDRALELTEALARHSLIHLDSTERGPRPRMLDTIREFVAERLAARPDAAQIQRRHAGYYQNLAEQADRPLRGAGQNEWADRLQAEAGNLAAAIRWYLAHDPVRLPHLFRVLWPFWFLRGRMSEPRPWVNHLAPAFGSLDLQARAELAWTATVTALEVGDDPAVLSARERLGPLLQAIEDPFLHAVCQLAMAWTAEIADDAGGALREAHASLEQLRSQDEPFWTAVAVATVGAMEAVAGLYEAARGHLSEARDWGDQFGNAWLTANSRAYLGTLAVMQDRLDEARVLLDEALSLSLVSHSTQSMTLSLAAFARMASAQGNREQAALLVGAAEGLRRRAGRRVWPTMRRAEAELATLIRDALGADRFDQVFAVGSRLNQREALAAVQDLRSTGTRSF
jgi:predicted ATPase